MPRILRGFRLPNFSQIWALIGLLSCQEIRLFAAVSASLSAADYNLASHYITLSFVSGPQRVERAVPVYYTKFTCNREVFRRVKEQEGVLVMGRPNVRGPWRG